MSPVLSEAASGICLDCAEALAGWQCNLVANKCSHTHQTNKLADAWMDGWDAAASRISALGLVF